jgi:hypothetical protein
VPLFREHKIIQLEELLSRAIATKYKISLFKGMQMVAQSLIMLILACSMMVRGDVFALVYLVFVIRMMTANHDMQMQVMVRLVFYCSFTILFTYFVTVLNLTSSFSPVPMPDGLENYPLEDSNTDGLNLLEETGKYVIPVFFKMDAFKELRVCYLLGVGVERSQMLNIYFDFMILYCTAMYLVTYGNPLLQHSLEKVFWSFPLSHDPPKKWERVSTGNL